MIVIHDAGKEDYLRVRFVQKAVGESFPSPSLLFTARRLAKRGICRRRVSVCVCVCLCVFVSVCPSHSGIVSKRLNVGSRKQRRTIDSSFLTPKIVAKFERDHPLRGRRMQVGWVKIGQFRRKTRYNSITVQDRRIVSIKVE